MALDTSFWPPALLLVPQSLVIFYNSYHHMDAMPELKSAMSVTPKPLSVSLLPSIHLSVESFTLH